MSFSSPVLALDSRKLFRRSTGVRRGAAVVHRLEDPEAAVTAGRADADHDDLGEEPVDEELAPVGFEKLLEELADLQAAVVQIAYRQRSACGQFVRPVPVERLECLPPLLDVNPELRAVTADVVGDHTVEIAFHIPLSPGAGRPVQVQKQQVQGGEPLLAVHQKTHLALLLHVNERAEEERLAALPPAGAPLLPGQVEGLEEVGDQRAHVIRRPGVFPLVVVDVVGRLTGPRPWPWPRHSIAVIR